MKAFLQRAVLATLMLLATIMARAYDFEVDGIYYNKTSDTEVEVTNGEWNYSGDIKVPSIVTFSSKTYSVSSIGVHAFSNCSRLTSIELPNSVTSIGGYAFYFCTGLTSFEFPNSLTSIGEMAFVCCIGLTSIELPNSLTSNGECAFMGCSGLTSIKFPNSLTSIGKEAFGFCSGLTSIELPNSVTSIDHSAFMGCSGLTSVELPNSVISIGYNAFSECSGLTSIELPNSLTSIGGLAFSFCSNINEVTVLSILPPVADLSAFDSCNFTNSTLYVPAASYELYRNADVWKNWSNIVPIGEMGGTVALKVYDEVGNDITDLSNIEWFDIEQKSIGFGKSLSGLTDGAEVYYSVTLNEDLGRTYREVHKQKITVNLNESEISCSLKKIEKLKLYGRVSAPDIEKNSVTINLRQLLNGKYEYNNSTNTDEKGLFEVEGYDDISEINFSGDGYLDINLNRDGFVGNGNLGTVSMNCIDGIILDADISLTAVAKEGEAGATGSFINGLQDIEFTLTNLTNGNPLNEFSVQGNSLIIKSGASIGDKLELSAKSKKNEFADASITITLDEGINNFKLQLTELGGLDATVVSSDNGETVGYIYDVNSTLVAKGSYKGDVLSLRHLPAGDYTLITMGASNIMGSLTNLSDFASLVLSVNKDYIKNELEIKEGQITSLNVNTVPRFEDERFSYTTQNSYFTAGKSSITAGNYLSLSTCVDLKPEYALKAERISLTIELPEGCQMVENSVIANSQSVPHTVNGNKLTMVLNKEQSQSKVQFCVIPVQNKRYTLGCVASFEADGTRQLIGTAEFEASGLALAAPKSTSSKTVSIYGRASKNSDVRVYDNGVFIGRTKAKADGTWSADCDLYKPYNPSLHNIHAEITSPEGLELSSETQMVEYNPNALRPLKTMMTFYNGWYKENKTVEFNHQSGEVVPNSYPFYTESDFTFLTEFNTADTTRVKNVILNVLNSDGTSRALPASFDSKKKCWIATTKYSNARKLPVNVSVDYIAIPEVQELDSARIKDDVNQFMNLMSNYVLNADTSKCEILEIKDTYMTAKYQTTTMDEPIFIRMEQLNYNQSVGNFDENDFTQMKNGDAEFLVCDTVVSDRYVEILWNKKEQSLFQIELSKTNDFSPVNLRKGVVNKSIMGNMSGAAKMLIIPALDLFANAGTIWEIISTYKDGYKEYQYWLTQRALVAEQHYTLYTQTKAMIDAKCPDGEPKMYTNARGKAMFTLDTFFTWDVKDWRDSFRHNLNKIEIDLGARLNHSMVMGAFCSLIGAVLKAPSLGESFISNFNPLIPLLYGNGWNEVAAEIVPLSFKHGSVGTLGAYHAALMANMIGEQNGIYYTVSDLSEWYNNTNPKIIRNFVTIQDYVKANYRKCPERKEEPKDPPYNENDEEQPRFTGKGVTPILDPAGYVYEAVPSNRLEGVTTTCYQKVMSEDMYGNTSEQVIVWNAEEYSQKNPLKTDAAGFYRWDVPQGMWQVKYEKEGYETTYSDWLPVPPPQLEVNVGMKQTTPPAVKSMRGYESGIVVDMSKYMIPATLSTDNIKVERNGYSEGGSIEFINSEETATGEDAFVSKLKFIPANSFKTSDNVIVTIKKEVESYCGVKMTADHVEKVKIEPEIKSIAVDSLVTVPYNGYKEITVLAFPKEASAGKTLRANISSSIIASLYNNEVTLDENGSGVIRINGEVPGSAMVDFNIDGYEASVTSKVMITDDYVAAPTASVRSGENVESGTKVKLNSATDGAVIYYTLDGTCPCNESTALVYDLPINITSDAIIKAMAVKDGMDVSDIVTFFYFVKGSSGVADSFIDSDVKIGAGNGAITVSGAEGGGCRIFDLRGMEVASRTGLSAHESFTVKSPELYIVQVSNDNGKNTIRKVMVK